MKTSLTKTAGERGWSFSNDSVKCFLTRTGGQLAPVVFKLGRRSVQPFTIAPWTNERQPGVPTMLRTLRGDFFCAPFGANAATYRGEIHPPHGETANLDWTFESLDRTGDALTQHTSMRTRVRRGRVDKRLTIRDGHTAVYCEHVLSGFKGPMSIGTHPMLKFPDEVGAGAISTSGFKRGHVVPVAWETPAAKGYSWLKLGATFSSLKSVPGLDGRPVDISRYPVRRGYEELVQLVNDPRQPFAWSAVALPRAGYVFFAIKNPRVLKQTVLWYSNGGRHYPPWSGRHLNILGVEDVTAFFHLGLAESSKPNLLNRSGTATSVDLSPKRPLRVAHILALAAIPKDFDEVKSITAHQDGVKLTARNGKQVSVPLDVNFVL